MHCSYLIICIVFGVVKISGQQLEDFECLTEGRFALHDSCHGFITCVSKEDGAFRQIRGNCPGAYDSETGRCVSSREAKGCSRTGRSLPESSSQYNDLCSGGASFVCASCGTLITCADGTAYETSCGPDYTCTEKSFGSVCAPPTNDSCSCDGNSQFYQDSHREEGYYECGEDGTIKSEFLCPPSETFDENTGFCTENSDTPPCESQGWFASPKNCSIYYSCVNSRYQGYVKEVRTCDEYLQFDETLGECVDPCTTVSGSFSCQNEGRYGDPEVCSRYYDCISTADGEIQQIERSCPVGRVWQADETNPGTGSCVSGDINSCKPEPSKCGIPDFCDSNEL